MSINKRARSELGSEHYDTNDKKTKYPRGRQ
jgi:hypothetical protein